MAKYQQYESVLLKDGGSPQLWRSMSREPMMPILGILPKIGRRFNGITDDEIERKATEQEMDRKYRESMRQLREQGILE